MTASPHVRPRTASRRAAARRPAFGAFLLLLLLAVSPALDLALTAPGGIRVGGLALAWWYAGLAAPLLGWAVAAWSVVSARAEAEPAAGEPAAAPAPPPPSP